MNRIRMSRVLVVVIAAGCSSESTSATGSPDATVAGDTVSADSAAPSDAAGGGDAPSAAEDIASLADAAAEDAGLPTDVAATEDAAIPDTDGPDVGELDAGEPDVAPPDTAGTDDVPVSVDVPTPDDVEADAGPAPSGGGETCEEAIDLAEASGPTGGMDYPFIVSGAFGASDDLNPLKDSGLAPACSLVYDAKGKEVVYTIELSPGEILDMRYMVTPVDHPGGMYILDSCTTWPDYDGSGMCGSNEYKSQGYCGVVGQCDPIEFNFLYPDTETGKRRFWIVLDEVAGDTAASYTLEWNLIAPK